MQPLAAHRGARVPRRYNFAPTEKTLTFDSPGDGELKRTWTYQCTTPMHKKRIDQSQPLHNKNMSYMLTKYEGACSSPQPCLITSSKSKFIRTSFSVAISIRATKLSCEIRVLSRFLMNFRVEKLACHLSTYTLTRSSLLDSVLKFPEV